MQVLASRLYSSLIRAGKRTRHERSNAQLFHLCGAADRRLARQADQALTGDPDFMTSLARGLAVVQAFQERKRHLTIAQISHRTEIPRAAVRRCLHTLIKLGYATTDGRTYSLLPKVLTLGHAYLSSTPLAVSAQPYLDRMSEQLHEACNMATLEGDDILYIARSATTQRLISVDLSVGGRLPAYCTSMGRILLAALDDTSLGEYLDHAELVAKTSRTIHTPRPCLNVCSKCDSRAGASSTRNWSRACVRLRCRCMTLPVRWWRRSTSAPMPVGSAAASWNNAFAGHAERQSRPQRAVVCVRKLFDKRTELRLSN